MHQRKEPHRRLADHMAAAHDMVWGDEQNAYVKQQPGCNKGDAMMGLKIESGHPVRADVQPVAGTRVRFVTDDGRTMFEVCVGRDGRSIELRAVDTTTHGDELYDIWLLVQPVSANTVLVRTAKYVE